MEIFETPTPETNKETSTERSAIIVLTRGYPKSTQYNMLIKRNVAIAKRIGSMQKTDILIFHEGNITPSQQTMIADCTPRLNILFISIQEHAFKKEKENYSVYAPTRAFGINYRHMCSFWFVDFWNYVKEYDKILRIDDDCLIDFDIPTIFQELDSKVALYGTWAKDEAFVTQGLNAFTANYLKDQGIKQIPPHNPSGPYTNVIALHLARLRENELLQNYIKQVDASNAIYIFRWGDLALWGEAFFYLCRPNSYGKTDKIKYFHGSHTMFVEDTKMIKK